jgi:hypothetical protein
VKAEENNKPVFRRCGAGGCSLGRGVLASPSLWGLTVNFAALYIKFLQKRGTYVHMSIHGWVMLRNGGNQGAICSKSIVHESRNKHKNNMINDSENKTVHTINILTLN